MVPGYQLYRSKACSVSQSDFSFDFWLNALTISDVSFKGTWNGFPFSSIEGVVSLELR